MAKLSVIGYSLGGLVARYAVGLLHAKGILDKMECKNFIAFASPFLGARSPVRGTFSALFNAVGARSLSESGRQLFGIDTFRDTGRPLLAVMADPETIFMAGLRRFARRTLYANVANDRSAPYYTTSISKTDPFAVVEAEGGVVEDLPVNFATGYSDVVLDRDEPLALDRLEQAMKDVRLNTAVREERRKATRASVTRALRQFLVRPWSRDARLALFEAAPMLALSVILPLGLTVFLVGSVYQTVQSTRRRQLHEDGLAGIDIASYRVPLWMQGLRETVEDAYEDINTSHKPEFEGPEEAASSSSLGSDSDSTGDDDSIAQAATGASTADKKHRFRKHLQRHHKHRLSLSQKQLQAETLEAHHGKAGMPVLALSDDQFAMIDNLDSLGWRKYRVWIHKVRHSHAAIIVRSDSPRLEEGKTVLRHFINEEFLM